MEHMSQILFTRVVYMAWGIYFNFIWRFWKWSQNCCTISAYMTLIPSISTLRQWSHSYMSLSGHIHLIVPNYFNVIIMCYLNMECFLQWPSNLQCLFFFTVPSTKLNPVHLFMLFSHLYVYLFPALYFPSTFPSDMVFIIVLCLLTW